MKTGRVSYPEPQLIGVSIGTGFHPELMGRENVYLNGAVIGMRRDEIKRKFEEIVAFAEIERSVVLRPTKTYAAGETRDD